jgi:hypothetical protein
LWPEEPTADVAHLMSLGCDCDQAAEAVIAIEAATATVDFHRRFESNQPTCLSLIVSG